MPIIIGFITIPILVTRLGMDRFGLLSLLWAVLGYLTFFDLGLSRAIIKIGAEFVASSRKSEIPQFVWTTLWITGLLSLLGCLILITISHFLVTHYFNIPSEFETEGLNAVKYIAFSLPIVTLTAVLKGLLESQSEFLKVNILHAINGTLTYLSPVFVSLFSPRIDLIILAISIFRLFLLLVHWRFCIFILPQISQILFPTRQSSSKLLKFGSWLTISNIISPIMVYFDRFFLGSIISVGDLAYYTTPYEIITRVLILPYAIARTLFPAFSTTLNLNPSVAIALYPKVLRMVAFIMAIVASFFIALSSPGLLFWLGPEFSTRSSLLLQLFTIGIFFNAIANIPYTYIQSAGRPDLTAIIHLLESPIYLLLLWSSAYQWGTTGAAASWSLRLIVDCILLLFITQRLTHQKVFKNLALFKIITPLLILWFLNNSVSRNYFLSLINLMPLSMSQSLILNISSLLFIIFYLWSFYLNFEERTKILGHPKFSTISTNPENEKNKFAAVIVTFNPSENFSVNLKSISQQFDRVCVVDNASKNISWIFNECNKHNNIHFIGNDSNNGLGKALNQGMEFFKNSGIQWIATFDQDSTIPPHYLSEMKLSLESYHNPENIGIIAPTIFESNLEKKLTPHEVKSSELLIPVPTVFTSGSLISVKAYELAGQFDESYFIDYIDHKFAFRLRAQGFIVAKCPHIQIIHSLGASKSHHLFLMQFYCTHHSPIRRYYITRNRVHFYKEFFIIDPAWIILDIYSQLKEITKIILVESDKSIKIKFLIWGFVDGFSGKYGPYKRKEKNSTYRSQL